jgi:hypothetical protein
VYEPASRPPRLAWATAAVAIGMLLAGWRWVSMTETPTSVAGHYIRDIGGARHHPPRSLEAVSVDAPDRLERAFGRSDSLILASDFAEEGR